MEIHHTSEITPFNELRLWDGPDTPALARMADQLVGNVRAVEVAGVDVVDAARHCRSQDRECAVPIFGRPEHSWSSELHRTVTHAPHGARAERERSGFADINHDVTLSSTLNLRAIRIGISAFVQKSI